MSNIYVEETYINKTEGYRFGESEPVESFTNDTGQLFKTLQREHGRCVSRVYVDQKDAPPKAIGWVFEKRMKYEDARTNGPEAYYVREVWVTLHREPPTKTVKHHYFDLAD